MDPDFERKYHAFEDNYWWFRARRKCVARLVKHSLEIPLDAKILEVGCSGGPLLQLLAETGYQHLTGADLSHIAVELCRGRGLADVHVMDATAPAFPECSFDLIIASDVLEHIEDHERALSNWRRLLKPGGKLIVFVPAFGFLWSEHDIANRHFRRYTASSLKKNLKIAGFSVERTSYWNTALFPAVAMVRLTKRVLGLTRNRPNDQLHPLNPLFNALLECWMGVENILLSTGLRLPIGVSVMAIAQKR